MDTQDCRGGWGWQTRTPDMAALSVRPMTPLDVPRVVSYVVDSSPEDRERLGMTNVPARETLTGSLLEACTTPQGSARSFYLIWEVEGRPVGFSSLKGIVPGEHGGMHLHMWETELRGRGFGAVLFCRSAVEFHDRFRLRSIVCEPRAANPAPNRMLRKIGFPLVRTYVGASSELSAVCELNRYEILREVAEAYLSAPGS